MDTRNGSILEMTKLKNLSELEQRFFKQMEIPPTEKQLKNGKVDRNDPCPCGSGIKFKKCCLHSIV